MTIHIIKHGSNEYKQMLDLRDNILRKPLGLTFSEEEIHNERTNVHIGAFENGELLGCCMLIPDTTEKIRLRQMAVRHDFQGKGIGRALISFAESYASSRNCKVISMHARKTAADFYQKLGYKIIGEEFMELNIPHYYMEKDI